MNAVRNLTACYSEVSDGGISVASPTSSSAILIEREAIIQNLSRILGSPVFRNSKRYPALLKYIVEETLDGRGDAIKERVLGVEVFGRSPDYDTGSDHVVRTAAGEVRKRLAQYYLNEGSEDEIRIDVPAGSYVPQFRMTAEPTQLQPVEDLLALPAAETEGPAVPRKWPGVSWPFIGSLVLNALLAGALALITLPWQRGASTLQKFWEPVFSASNPMLICVGLRDGNQGPGAAPITDPLLHRVSMAELLALSRVTSYAGERHARYRILDPASTNFSDIRDMPTVLIGVGNNSWTKQLAAHLRFGFLMNEADRPYGIHDNQNHAEDWLRGDQRAQTYRDYAIVSRLLDPRVEQVVVMIGGVGPHGTEAAGEFVSNPDQIRKLEAFAPSGWAGKNLQVVLSTEVVKGSSGPPHIEAAYFW
jgi:hypothetical protein